MIRAEPPTSLVDEKFRELLARAEFTDALLRLLDEKLAAHGLAARAAAEEPYFDLFLDAPQASVEAARAAHVARAAAAREA